MRKFTREWIDKYPSIEKIHNAIAGQRRMGSEGTVTTYVNGVGRFVKYIGFNDPETALQAMLNGGVDTQTKVDSFIEDELDIRSHSTVRGSVFGIRKWFELNGVKIDWAKIEMPTSSETVEDDRIPTKEELRKLLSHTSSARDRFVICCSTSSGLRLGTLVTLKMGDVDMSYPDVARIQVERKKGRKFTTKRSPGSGKLYCTFITPEAKKALQIYISERENNGEKITSESPLITDYTFKGHFLKIDAVERVWGRLLQRAGLGQKSNRCFKLHFHVLRKYFRSNCINVDASYRERWMGHQGKYLDMSYFKAEENLHLNEYRKTISHLTIAETIDEKKQRANAVMDFAKIQGHNEDKIRKMQEILARAKDVDEAIDEIRKFQDLS
jgi:integrase